jgi:hypothetical protein
MGSKSSSKSSSKSLLPKGLNLMHVVLAVVLGLLICSMLSTGNVEGFTAGSKGYTSTTANTAKKKCPQGTKWTKGPDTFGFGCYSGNDASNLNAYKALVDASTDPDRSKNKTEPGTLEPGICKGKFSSNADKLCSHINDDKTCVSEGAGICSWRKTDDMYSYSGGLEGVIYYDWMKALKWYDNGGFTEAGTTALVDQTTKVDLIPLRMSGSAISAVTPTTGQKNFLDIIKANTPADALNSDKIPKLLRQEVADYVEACKSGWDKYPDEYILNGGKPIMGYNVADGLVCRNPLHYPIIQPGNVSRIHDGEEGGCPSPTASNKKVSKKGHCEKRTSACNWPPSKTWGGMIGGAVYNNTPFYSGGPCGLDSCAAENAKSCAKVNAKNTIKDGAAWAASFFKVG